MMNDQAPILYYDVTGDRRKELVQALGEILLWEPKYQGAPSFSYHIGNYIVDRNGTVMCPDCVTTEIAEQLIQNLMERGFTPTSTTLDLYIISLPRSMYDDPALNRLRNLVKSKDTILRAALKTHRLQIEVDDEKVYFPWFHITGVDGEAQAYVEPQTNETTRGKYTAKTNTVRIYESNIPDHYCQRMGVLAHEMWHTYQEMKASYAPTRHYEFHR